MALEYTPIPEDLWDDWLWLVKAEGLQLDINEGPYRLGTSMFALRVRYSIHIPKLVLHMAANGGWFDSEACRLMIQLALITTPMNIVAGGEEGTDLGLETHLEGKAHHMKVVFGCLRQQGRVLAVIPAVGPAESVALEKGANNARSSALIMKCVAEMLARKMLQNTLQGWVIAYHGHRISEIEPLDFLATRCEVLKLEPDQKLLLENVPDEWS